MKRLKGLQMSLLTRFTPESLRGYQPAWLKGDIVAGVTLAAVAIPETMGYTSIAQTPVVTGLYTVLFPTIVFALLGSSRLLVVGADSATAATPNFTRDTPSSRVKYHAQPATYRA